MRVHSTAFFCAFFYTYPSLEAFSLCFFNCAPACWPSIVQCSFSFTLALGGPWWRVFLVCLSRFLFHFCVFFEPLGPCFLWVPSIRRLRQGSVCIELKISKISFNWQKAFLFNSESWRWNPIPLRFPLSFPPQCAADGYRGGMGGGARRRQGNVEINVCTLLPLGPYFWRITIFSDPIFQQFLFALHCNFERYIPAEMCSRWIFVVCACGPTTGRSRCCSPSSARLDFFFWRSPPPPRGGMRRFGWTPYFLLGFIEGWKNVLRPLLVLSWVGTPGLGKKPVCGVCGGDRKQPRPSLTNQPHSRPFPLTPRPSGLSPEACLERLWRMDRLKPVFFSIPHEQVIQYVRCLCGRNYSVVFSSIVHLHHGADCRVQPCRIRLWF